MFVTLKNCIYLLFETSDEIETKNSYGKIRKIGLYTKDMLKKATKKKKWCKIVWQKYDEKVKNATMTF